jgi:DNA helicase HerA-like ATPase
MNSFFKNAEYQENPIAALDVFLREQEKYESAGVTEKMRFVGYVIELGYDSARIITSDPYKQAVGGIPRGTFLVMVPFDIAQMVPHFTLLRVEDVAPTPLGPQVQQTYFELHKKSMPELDIWTQSELQWGALSTSVLGMFYPNQSETERLDFAGDVNAIVSAHRYKVYAPDDDLLNLIVNGTIRREQRFSIGRLRVTESQLPFNSAPLPNVSVDISVKDFTGFRTAMFGKTRLGKSNVVKLIASAVIENNDKVGQLIFDINGEYANDNPQDGDRSIRSIYKDRCQVFALNQRDETPSEPLRLNFYEQPSSTLAALASLLRQNKKDSNYIQSFASVELTPLEEIPTKPFNEQTRDIRKIQIYWAILKKAGFQADESKLKSLGLRTQYARDFDPHYSKKLRDAAYKARDQEPPDEINTLQELVNELEVIQEFRLADPKRQELKSENSGDPHFDDDAAALMDFFSPKSGSGPSVLRPYRRYHSPQAGDFAKQTTELLDQGMTVILDLGNATEELRRYFADMLSAEVFNHQEQKFVDNALGDSYVQLYFEEAHNLFPRDAKEMTDVYSRFAKEGAKFHIGIVYSTQSPSTISQELLAQTENFFVGHLSSQDEVRALERVQVAYQGLGGEIMKAKTPGYMRMLTFSHRFVVPVQARKFGAGE